MSIYFKVSDFYFNEDVAGSYVNFEDDRVAFTYNENCKTEFDKVENIFAFIEAYELDFNDLEIWDHNGRFVSNRKSLDDKTFYDRIMLIATDGYRWLSPITLLGVLQRSGCRLPGHGWMTPVYSYRDDKNQLVKIQLQHDDKGYALCEQVCENL